MSLKEKIANAKSTNWPAEGLSEEEVREIIEDVLSCKVGDIIFFPLCNQEIKEVTIESIIINDKDILLQTDFYIFSIKDIGKTIFLTEKDARKNAEKNKVRRFRRIFPEKESE